MSRGLLIACLWLAIAAPAHAEGLTAEQRRAITLAFLEGNPSALHDLRPTGRNADDWFPLILYEHWWRPPSTTEPPEPRTLPEQALFPDTEARRASSLTRRRIDWIAAPDPKPVYPMPGAGETDPWPVLSALVLDRTLRERGGVAAVLEHDPLGELTSSLRRQQDAGTLTMEQEHQLWWLDQARNDISYSYAGEPPTEAQRAAEAEGRAIARRNLVVALLALALLIGVPIAIGRRARARGASAGAA